MPLNLKALARELDDLRAQAEEDPAVVLDDEDLGRVHDLEGLESQLSNDLHVLANRCVSLLTEEEAAAQIRDELEGEVPSAVVSHVDWDGVASDLLTDWTIVTFDDEDYYTRDL